MDTNKNIEKKVGVFIIESQPPMFGELLAILGVLEQYDALFICIKQTNIVIDYSYAVMAWHKVLSKLKTETELYVTYSDTEFEEIITLPNEYKNIEILTFDYGIYVHLSSIGAKCKLVNRPIGYRSEFFRAAYRQSKALDFLLGSLRFGK